MRALVVDDSRTVRLIVSNILAELGMEVLQAADGVEAQEQTRRNPGVDLMLVDWNMPRLNGLEFVRWVRSERTHDHVRIMRVTSEAQGAQVIQALQAGANEYLMKPFDKEVLLAKLSLMDISTE